MTHKDFSEFDEKENPLGFLLGTDIPVPATTSGTPTVTGSAGAGADDDICQVMEVDPGHATGTGSTTGTSNIGKKRNLDEI